MISERTPSPEERPGDISEATDVEVQGLVDLLVQSAWQEIIPKDRPMLLYIVRHAWAEERGPKYPNDDLRPLTDAGKKRFKKMARTLVKRGVCPRVLATSPLLRCRQTAEILAAEIPGHPDVEVVDALQPDSNLEDIIAWTARQDVAEIAWVGHAPDVSSLCGDLICGSGSGLRFAKGAIASISFPQGVQVGAGELQWHITAKMLGV